MKRNQPLDQEHQRSLRLKAGEVVNKFYDLNEIMQEADWTGLMIPAEAESRLIELSILIQDLERILTRIEDHALETAHEAQD